jgi:luciferase family oxidoreductase group 1
MPSDVRIPSMWMLGSTLAGASIGAQLGVPYAFAGHFAMRNAREAIQHYKSSYEPSALHPKPHAMLAVTVVCGESDEHAERLAAPIRVAVAKTRAGKPAPILSVEDALEYVFSPMEQVAVDDFMLGAILAGPATIKARLMETAESVGADELMLSTLIPSLADRRAGLERIAAAMA